MMDYKFQRGFLNIVMNMHKNLPEVERANRRINFIITIAVMRRVFGNLYHTLIEKKEIEGFWGLPTEYQKELNGVVCECLPVAKEEERGQAIEAIIAFLWLLNN